MKHSHLLTICMLLTACGSGGDSAPPVLPAPPLQPAPPVQPVPVPAPTLTLSSPTLRTLAGGSAIPVTAKLSSGGAVRWQLAAGSPGTLSTDTGGAVSYVPPSGALAAPAYATVTATGDNASAALTLVVTPDPGAPRVERFWWRTGTDPTRWEPVDLAADAHGNVYVLLEQVGVTPLMRGTPRLVKIAPDGAMTWLVDTDKTWFGQPFSRDKANQIYETSGFAADRAENLYFAVSGFFSHAAEVGMQISVGAAILKISPAGEVSVLAGSRDAQVGAMTDGTGSAARFLYPRVQGIDYDGNVYVLDKNDTPRKVTPAGIVTTLSALPASLDADMNGNTYRYDPATQKLLRTSPGGVTVVETSVPYCAAGIVEASKNCLAANMGRLIPIGGVSYVTIDAGGLKRIILGH